MNHPDKISVPGSGIKNRYRTIVPSLSVLLLYLIFHSQKTMVHGRAVNAGVYIMPVNVIFFVKFTSSVLKRFSTLFY